jgi:hypothetical protein
VVEVRLPDRVVREESWADPGDAGRLDEGTFGDGAAREIRFPWRPSQGREDDYAADDPQDQHRIVFFAERRGPYPVLIAMHGQPRRGESPRNYAFLSRVIDTARRAREDGSVGPFLLVLPVFRFHGENWPHFDLLAFRTAVDALLAREGFSASAYYVIGHSGAAGCGGEGMNQAHRMQPAGVGFFDTCLGASWREEVRSLQRAHVPTLMIHSLETAGFTPRQTTEYLPTFDFGLAYGPAGLSPSACPDRRPDAPLRAQPFQCASDRSGATRAFIVDSGVGEEGHNAVVPIAVRYFLREYVNRSFGDANRADAIGDAQPPRD